MGTKSRPVRVGQRRSRVADQRCAEEYRRLRQRWTDRDVAGLNRAQYLAAAGALALGDRAAAYAADPTAAARQRFGGMLCVYEAAHAALDRTTTAPVTTSASATPPAPHGFSSRMWHVLTARATAPLAPRSAQRLPALRRGSCGNRPRSRQTRPRQSGGARAPASPDGSDGGEPEPPGGLVAGRLEGATR